MPREILFRGERIDTSEIIYGSLMTTCGECEISDMNTVDGARYDVFPHSVAMYTGFTDAGKAKIFEGDIIENDGTQYAVVWDEDGGMWDAVDDEGNNIALHELAQSRDTWLQS